MTITIVNNIKGGSPNVRNRGFVNTEVVPFHFEDVSGTENKDPR